MSASNYIYTLIKFTNYVDAVKKGILYMNSLEWFENTSDQEIGDVFGKLKMHRMATKNTEVCL